MHDLAGLSAKISLVFEDGVVNDHKRSPGSLQQSNRLTDRLHRNFVDSAEIRLTVASTNKSQGPPSKFRVTPVDLRSTGVILCMPVRRKLSHKVLVSRLLASTKLNDAERQVFEELEKSLRAGGELTDHQKLWIEVLRTRIEG